MVFTNGLLEDSNRLEPIIREVVNLNIIRRQRLRIEVTSRLELIYSHAVHSDTRQVHTCARLRLNRNEIGILIYTVFAGHDDFGVVTVQLTRGQFYFLSCLAHYIGKRRHLRLCYFDSRRRQHDGISEGCRIEVFYQHAIQEDAGQEGVIATRTTNRHLIGTFVAVLGGYDRSINHDFARFGRLRRYYALFRL